MAQSPSAPMRRNRSTQWALSLVATVSIAAAAACSESRTGANDADGVLPTIVDDSAVAARVVDASAYAVFDTQRATMLATTNADARLPVGSLMKLLNAAVAYDAGQPDKKIVAPDG